MARQVRFYAHACLAVEGETETLLTDPWLFGEVFNGAWSLCAPPDLDAIDWHRVRHIFVSHEHPDHQHFPSLRVIRERISGPLTVYQGRRRDPAARRALAELGFRVRELAAHEEVRIAGDIAGTLFPTGDDTALAIRLGDRVIVNQNDASLTRDEVDRLRRQFPRIDAWFFQFSLGGYCANADDSTGLAAARARHLATVERYCAALRPQIFVPFASFFAFAKEGNDYLNDWTVTPAELLDALPDLPTQILCAGDALLWQGWQPRNARNRERWQAALRGRRRPKPHAPVDERALEAAGRALLAEVAQRGLRFCAPGETHLRIRETGRTAAIDCRRGRFEWRDRADRRRLAVDIPGDELLYFLGSPHGASVYFGGCYHVVDAERWRRLRGFRERLSRGRIHHLGALARAYLARLDRARFGSRLSRWHARVRARSRPLDV